MLSKSFKLTASLYSLVGLMEFTAVDARRGGALFADEECRREDYRWKDGPGCGVANSLVAVCMLY